LSAACDHPIVREIWPSATLLLAACFEANPLVGVRCDPGAPSCPFGQACIATADGFACLPEGTPPVDAPPPPPPPPASCPEDDPALILCFDFDAPALASPLPNQGRAPVGAELVNVTRITHGDGGAAQLGATSTMFVPPDNMSIVGIVAMEASIRLDVAVPDGMRVGILDADVDLLPGLSVFVFGRPAGAHQLRCSLGSGNLFVDLPPVVGQWIDIACTCTNDLVELFVDGIKRGELAGCVPATASELGLQIGQNSNAGAGDPPNEPMIGALDDVRLRSAP
jgi:hypothetical protein